MVEDNPDGATLHPGIDQAFASFWVVPRLIMAQARLASLDCFGRISLLWRYGRVWGIPYSFFSL